MKKVSLYIPCYNGERFIEACLESVLRQQYPVEEIIVVDDGSTDRSAQIVGGYPVRLIRHKANRGLAAARNTAFLAAKGEYVASLDADCAAAPDWLAVLMEGFRDERVAGVGGRVIEAGLRRLADRWRSVHMKQHWGPEALDNPKFLYGSNTVFRAGVVREQGLYDQRYTTNYEDVALSGRIRSAGYTMRYLPQAMVTHLRTDTLGSAAQTFWKWTVCELPQASTPLGFLRKQCSNVRLFAAFFLRDLCQRHAPALSAVDLLFWVYFFFYDLRTLIVQGAYGDTEKDSTQ